MDAWAGFATSGVAIETETLLGFMSSHLFQEKGYAPADTAF
jgi:hypothetical protein